MTSLLLQHPEWGVGVASTLAVVALALLLVILRARDRTERLLGDRNALPWHRLRADALPFTALLLIGVALLGPRSSERDVVVSTSGVDVVLLMDVSQSMWATDTPPSRMLRAREAALGLMNGLAPGDRVALAAFAGRGALLTPLTPDRDALARMLPALDMRLMRPGGTDLDAGVAAALEALEPGSRRPGVIVVLSDGEVTESSGDEAGLLAAARAGVRIVALALGSTTGAEVPDQGAPLRDAAGRIVISRRHDASLERLTRMTGGAFAVADAWGRFDLTSILSEVRSELAQAEGDTITRRELTATVLPFASAAALLLLLDALPLGAMSQRAARSNTTMPARATARARPAPRAVPALLCTLPLLLLGAGRPGEPWDDADAAASLRRGLALAEVGDWPAAWDSLQPVATFARDPEQAALAWYNLGVIYLEIGPLVKARDAFYEALALRADDHQARFNLEWTLLAIARDETSAPPAVAPRESPDDEREPTSSNDEDDRSGESQVGQGDPETPDGSDPPSQDARPSTGAESAQARGSEAGAGERTRLDALDESDVKRWLDRVEDDPGRGVRALARRSGERRAPRGPSW
jgi:Ca-activated chloride channel family protein